MRIRSFGVAVALIGAVVCGKNPTAPSPSPAQPTPTALAISPSTDLLTIKAVETFSASATYSDGTSRTVQAAWTSDNTAVATVDASAGRATGVGPGEATVAAAYQGMEVTRLLRVVPDYDGKWSGSHAVTSCTDDGAWAQVDACKEFLASSPFRFALALSQTRDTVTGTVDFGSPGSVEGTVRMSGHLTLSGTFTETVEDMTLETTVSDWETLTLDNERMSGRFTVRFRMLGVDGSVRFKNELQTVAKMSMTPLTRPGEGGGVRRSLSAVVQRLRRR
jgi:hypothetical protein